MTHAARLAVVCLLGVSLPMAAPAQGERIVIDGSTGVTPLVQALAKAYMEQNPTVVVEIGKGLGTKARIQALSDGKIDIAMASHGLDVAGIKRAGMAVQEIGKIAVVFGVNAGVPVTELSESQICDIYAGKVQSWKQVGGPDLAIVPLTRPESEVDTEVVRDKIACLKTLRIPDHVKVMPKAPDMAKELAAAPGAIGMTTTTVVEQSQGRVKAVSISGIAPTAQNVQSNKYVLTRDSFLVTKAPPPSSVAHFLEFIRSAAGEKVVVANGAIPVK
jgi:phosphate transport system substrate-binding protein